MRILVERYNALGGRGDILLATPVFPALKEKFPGCHITLFTAPHLAVIMAGNPHIDEITCKRPRRSGFDRVIRLDYIRLPANLHIIDAFAINAHVKLENKKPFIYLSDSHHREAQRFMDFYGLRDSDLTIAVHRGPTWPERMWPQKRYPKAADYFKEKYNARFIELSQFKGMGLGLGIDLTGKTSIRQTAAILKRCKLLLCVDSFLLHLASAVDTPTVALFGCTNPALRLPFNDISTAPETPSKCRWCYHKDQRRQSNLCTRDRIYCMESISVESVIESMETILRKTGAII